MRPTPVNPTKQQGVDVPNLHRLHVVADISSGCAQSLEFWLPEFLHRTVGQHCTVHLVGNDMDGKDMASHVKTFTSGVRLLDKLEVIISEIGNGGHKKEAVEEVKRRIPIHYPVLVLSTFRADDYVDWMKLGQPQANLVLVSREEAEGSFAVRVVDRPKSKYFQLTPLHVWVGDGGKIDAYKDYFTPVTDQALKFLEKNQAQSKIVSHEF